MRTVVQFGAGAIGRGFLGQLWTEGGYEVVFVDIDRALVDALNARGSYPLRLLGADSDRTVTVGPVRALAAEHVAAVAREVAACAFAATAVGAAHVEDVGRRLIAPGLAARYDGANAAPLPLFCCENGMDVPARLTSAILATMPGMEKRLLVAQTVVGRMVPPPDPDRADPLVVAAEPYARLPFFAGENPGAWPAAIPGLVPVASHQEWEREKARKLYTHNGGHAVLAYHGFLAGHEYIWQATEDSNIVEQLRGFWAEVDRALFAGAEADQRQHEDDLLRRFRNRALGDDVVRVGRDPGRKLAGNDRLVGAALRCLEMGMEPVYAAHAIAAALRFDPPADDPSAAAVQGALREGGVAGALGRFAGLPADHRLTLLVRDAYSAAATGSD